LEAQGLEEKWEEESLEKEKRESSEKEKEEV